ncbi:MAG: LysR family transcriptional regulator [Sulfuriferula sp.]
MEQLEISADDLLLFTAIAEQGSLVAAARQLAMPKATVSRRLAHLEAQLKQKLLIRTTRRLVLTEFGLTFLDHCQRVAEEVAATRDFVRSQEDQPQGRLRVSMPDDYARYRLSTAIATFTQQYKEIQLELDLSSRRVDLIGERFDLAIRMGTLEDDATLVARKIDEQSFSLYASPIYLALRLAPKTPEDLIDHDTVRLLSARGAPIPWKLGKGKIIWEGVPTSKLSVNSPGVIQQLLLDGAGIGALPDRFVIEDVRRKRLVRVLPEWRLPPVPTWAVMPTRRYLPAKTRVFLFHLEHFLKKI